MSKLTDFLGRLFRSTTVVTHPRDPVIAAWFGGTTNTGAGITVTPDQAMRFAVASACVRIIAESVATLPLPLYQRKPDGGREPDRAHPLYTILHDAPNEWQTAPEFWMMMVAQYLMRGNAYAQIVSSRRAPVKSLIPLHPDRITPFRAPDGTVAYRYQPISGEGYTFLQGEILHIRDLSMDGIVGLSRIEQAREAFGLGMALEQFGASYFKNGTTVGGNLEHPGKLSPEAYDRLKKSWDDRHSGVGNAHKPAILEEGMKWSSLGVPPDQAQFLESRRFQKDEIAMIFRVPPHMLANLERSTNNNIEQQSLDFVIYTLRPILRVIEAAIWRDLLTTSGKQTHFASFNVMGLLRGDSAARSNYYKAALGTTQQPGWMTPNEVRELEDMNPIQGGENLTPLITTMSPATSSSSEQEPKDEPADEGSRSTKPGQLVSVMVQAPDRVVRKRVTPSYDVDGNLLFADIEERETDS